MEEHVNMNWYCVYTVNKGYLHVPTYNVFQVVGEIVS